MTALTRLERADGIATITFSQPGRKNAMTLSMWSQLRTICADIAASDLADGGDRVVVLTGEGDSFVAGADISQFQQARATPGDQESYNATVNGAYSDIAALSQPSIAKVRGACVGGGTAIAVSADIRVAAQDARFGVPPARLGIGYPLDGVAALVRLIGPAWARQLLYTGDLIDAHTALHIGLVNEVVAPDELDDRVAVLARTISERAPLSQRAANLAVEAFYDERKIEAAEAAVERCAHSADYVEGVEAFLDKRPARFTGR